MYAESLLMPGKFAQSEPECKPFVRSGRLGVAVSEWHYTHMKLRIRELRKKKGLTGEQLADKLGTSKSYVSEMENGKKFPSGEYLRRLSEELEVSIIELFEDQELGNDIMSHIEVMKDLSAEDRRAVARHALGLLQKDAV